MVSIALYFIPIVLCGVTPFVRELSANRRWYVCLGVYLCLFYCFGYMTGADWRVYEDWYYNLDFSKFYYGYSREPGYYLYMMLFNRLGIGFWPFLIFTKTVIFIIIYKTIFDFCRENGYVSLMYFLPWSGMFLLIDNPMRNCIAVGIFIYSVSFVIEHKFWKFLLCMLLAASFHFSALLIIFFYPLLNRNIKTWVYVVLFIVVNFIFADREILVGMLTFVFGKIPFFQNKVFSYLVMDSAFAQGKLFSFGMVWQIFLFVLMACYRERITGQIGGEKGQFVFNAAMAYMLLLRFAMTIDIFSRFQLYFTAFLAIAIGLLILSFDLRSRILYMCLLFAVACYASYDRITSSARYVPYTNYLDYALKGEFPSYSKRYYYNMDHSPFTNEIDFE